jgi:hypothetical protein
MKKLLFACLFGAVGFAAQAQDPTQQTQTNNCCEWDDYVRLKVKIDPLLCLRLDGDDEAWVRYSCPSDFQDDPSFKKANNSTAFKFTVWANMQFDVSAHRHGNFAGPGANQIPGSSAQVALLGKNNIGGGTPNGNNFHDIPYYDPNDAANNAPENIITEAPPTSGDFTLGFKMKPLANAWNYAPGVHSLDVHVTITND